MASVSALRARAGLRVARYRADRSRARHRGRLRNEGFSIISNDCWGAEVYRHLELPYNTPFVGLFMFAPCYIRLLEDFDSALHAPLTFIDESRYAPANEDRTTRAAGPYPLALLGEDIELHFVHYSDETVALETWRRRVERISRDNLFVKYAADKDESTPELVRRFDALPFDHKVCLSREPYPGVSSARTIRGWEQNGANLFWIGLSQLDWIQWLNRESGTPDPA
jgi:uncharacterized protein (DUF1919 family)